MRVKRGLLRLEAGLRHLEFGLVRVKRGLLHRGGDRETGKPDVMANYPHFGRHLLREVDATDRKRAIA